MAAKKSSSTAAKKKAASSRKKAKSTADITRKKPAAASAKKSAAKSATATKTKKSTVPVNTFTIKQLHSDAPEVEPLMDDVEALEQEIEEMREGPDDNMDISYQPIRKPSMRTEEEEEIDDLDEVDSMDDVPRSDMVSDLENIPPRDIIKVKFGTFVNLVANHDMEDVVADNEDKEIIMEANLLTELASSRDERGERKVPLIFLVGIAIGVVLTYIFFST